MHVLGALEVAEVEDVGEVSFTPGRSWVCGSFTCGPPVTSVLASAEDGAEARAVMSGADVKWFSGCG